MTSMRGAWLGLGGPLEIALFGINSWQAYWALSNLAGMATDDPLNAAITGAVAVSLILGAGVLAVRLPIMSAIQWGVCLPVLIALMAFSVITSQLHLAQQIQGGHVASIKSSDAYQRADRDYRAAADNLDAVQAEIEAARSSGDVDGAAWIRRTDLPKAEARLEAARAGLADVSLDGQAGVASTIVTETAAAFHLTPAQFATALATAGALLMELIRLLLAWVAGNQLRRREASQPGEPRAATAVA